MEVRHHVAAPNVANSSAARPQIGGEPSTASTASAGVLDSSEFMKTAWFVLDRDSTPRRQALRIITQPWFDHIVLGLILLNCLTMAVRARHGGAFLHHR